MEGYTGPETYDALVKAGATVFGYGAFLTAVVQFLLLAFVIFWLIKAVTSVRKRLEAEAARFAKEEEAAATPAPTPEDIALLARNSRFALEEERLSLFRQIFKSGSCSSNGRRDLLLGQTKNALQ